MKLFICCIDCADRHVGCHGSCEKYQQDKVMKSQACGDLSRDPAYWNDPTMTAARHSRIRENQRKKKAGRF